MKFFSKIAYKNTWLIKIATREMFLSLAIILLPIFFPQTAYAGLFSFFSDNITGDQVSAQIQIPPDAPTSQTMSILQAAVNSNPQNSTNDLPVISGNALVAEVGPSGSLADIEDQPTNTQISTYVVHSGDTLSTIANLFDVSVNTIIWANDLGSSPTLREGETLIILPISGIKYTVKKGDTIQGIVSSTKADLDDVLQYNDLTLDSPLSVGDTIIIPNVEGSISVPTVTSTSPKKSSTKSAIPPNPVHDADGPSYPGYYIRPIDHGVVTQGLHGYNAVDLAAPIGTPIHAAADGIVLAVKTNGAGNGGYGNYVIISHANGTQTLYAHASKVLVSAGQHVVQGQLIAKIGVTGETTGPHVHFEIRGARNPFTTPVNF